MVSGRPRYVAAVAGAATVSLMTLVAGCGFGPGQSQGSAEVLITRDFGRTVMYEGEQSVRESDDAMRLLTRATDRVVTRYGGGFVDSIDGFGSDSGSDGSATDWFFYLDGEESPVGALEAEVEAGQSVWWDRRDWSAAMHVPAVVGSWPQPFASAADEVELECLMTSTSVCDGVQRNLESTGAVVRNDGTGEASSPLRVVVGAWSRLRRDSLIRSIEAGPAESGVYARFVVRERKWLLQPLDPSARAVGSPFRGGLVAAVSQQPGQVTWLVTATDESSVPRELIASALRHRYAVVYPAGRERIAQEVPRP